MKKLLSLLMCIMMVCVFVGGENVPSVLTASASTTVGTVKVKTEYNCTTDAIRIKWNKVSGASGYQVYRWNGKGWTVLKTIRDVNTLSYRDGSRSSGTLYKYKVKAFKKVNSTTVWGKASDTKYAVTRPKGVTIVASSKSSSAVRLRWTKQTCDGYQILKLKNGSWVKVTTIKNKDTNAYRIAGLASSTKYTFKVRPYKSDTKGGYMFGAADTITITTNASPTPVGANGQLRVSGANIVNKNGDKFQIKGMSTHGIMWEDFSDILSKESLKVLRDDWKVNTIRIAMYTEEWGGYTTGSDFAAQAKKKVSTGVENAKSLGMYAIID
ncbi:MAG: cellulase family glycosylhydrolase, partial [Oscillospiraceae bacterium]